MLWLGETGAREDVKKSIWLKSEMYAEASTVAYKVSWRDFTSGPRLLHVSKSIL